MMNEKINLYYFSSINFDFLLQRPQQIFRGFQQLSSTAVTPYYVEPLTKGRSLRKQASADNVLRNAFYCPEIKTSVPVLHEINRYLTLRSIGIKKKKGVVNVAIACIAEWEPFIAKDQFDIICYDVLDAIDVHTDKSTYKRYKIKHNKFIDKSDIVFVTADRLYDEIKAYDANKTVLSVTNGVDSDYFIRYKTTDDKLDYVKKDRHVAGYVGAIYDWIDVEMLFAAAERLPDIDFVILGPISDNNIKHIPKKPDNLIFIGAKPYCQVPAYINMFDVGLIPFKNSIVSASTDPIKLYEYFALGKPVVSTQMKQLEKFQDQNILVMADGVDEFVAGILHFLNSENIGINRMAQISSDNSWSNKSAIMLDAIISII